MQDRTCPWVAFEVVIEHILGVSDDPTDDLNSVMLEHAAHKTTHCAADEGFDSQFGNLLNATPPRITTIRTSMTVNIG